jgi:hypothetical protein
MLALTSNGGYADAYGVAATATEVPIDPADPDPVQIGLRHLLIAVKHGLAMTDPALAPTEVTFDEADIEGTFAVPGHPGVIGLFLTSSPIGDPTAIAPAVYVVDDLRPADNGYEYRRGQVWPPGEQAHPYP